MAQRSPENREMSFAERERERARREKNYDDTIGAIKVIAIAAFLIWFAFG